MAKPETRPAKADRRPAKPDRRPARPEIRVAKPEPEASLEKRYFRIGEVSRITEIKPYVLRYWESEFRWMAPQKSRSKQRLYRRRDIDIILLIKKLLYEQRFTLAGARKKLRELGVGRALEEGTLLVETNHRDRFRKLRDELQVIRALL